MRYWLHPEAQEELREAAEFYRERAGNALALALLKDFEHAVALLPEHTRLVVIWRPGRRRGTTRGHEGWRRAERHACIPKSRVIWLILRVH